MLLKRQARLVFTQWALAVNEIVACLPIAMVGCTLSCSAESYDPTCCVLRREAVSLARAAADLAAASAVVLRRGGSSLRFTQM